MQIWNAGCQWRSKQSCASALPPLIINLLKMKTKKSAASAALKTNDKKSVSSAPMSPPSAPIIAASAPTSTLPAPKSTPGTAPATPSAPKPASVAKKSKTEALTTIEVKIDVGFGNAVFLRGQGSGLTWEHGVPLACVDGCTWRWSQKVADPVTFKVLLNDQVWCAGSDFVVAPGQKVEVSPCFA
jgi:hypothetical protein